MNFKSLLVLGLLVLSLAPHLAPVPAVAADWKIVDDDEWCRDGWRDARYCEVRETTLDAGRSVIGVDGGDNGGITVQGWDKDHILLRAKVRVWDRSSKDAEEFASKIEIETDRTIRADGPDRFWRKGGWSVSFELMVPHESNLDLQTTNGGITIEEVSGDIEFGATNGGINLAGVGGDVHGRTTNGGISVEFDGDSWKGRGLDVKTTNGGIKLYVPEDYSARLETGTVNGSIHLDFPMTVQGTIGKSLKTELGDGGATVRVRTTNGGVNIRRS
jgi:hypothetical protein